MNAYIFLVTLLMDCTHWEQSDVRTYTQYPIIRNGEQKWAREFIKNYQFPDTDRFLILQGWSLAVC